MNDTCDSQVEFSIKSHGYILFCFFNFGLLLVNIPEDSNRQKPSVWRQFVTLYIPFCILKLANSPIFTQGQGEGGEGDLHRTPSFSLRQKGVNTNSIRSLYSGIQGIFHSFEKATLGEK